MDVDLHLWKLPWKLVEIDLLTWKLVEGSMEVHRRCHRLWKWKLPLLPSFAAYTYTMEASMSFHIPLHTVSTSTNIAKLPAASTRLL